MSFDLTSIIQIVETSNISEVNNFLDEGWRLIDTYSTMFSFETDDKVEMYILGKPLNTER
ncbi:MAG: hypothetical protein Q8930_00935 [Bacillota bacterium]|nr:hypothetical protein [Bacillota bacterium]